MPKPRILLHFSREHGFSWCAEEGVEVVCIDSNAREDDRIYVTQGEATPEQFDEGVDRAIRNEPHDYKLS